MKNILNELYRAGIVPVVKIEDVNKAVPLAKALMRGGLSCIEITFRTQAAEKAIEQISKTFPHMLIGAGTVLTVEQVDNAVKAGAKFIVSPGFNAKVVDYCIQNKIAVIPGCATPSDMEAAIEKGLTAVKFFPAEAAGGINYIKAVSAPYGALSFMPTGGISQENICDYLAFDRVIACGGSWMVNPSLIRADKFDEIEQLCKNAVTAMHGFELSHVGINPIQKDDAVNTSLRLEELFGFTPREIPAAFFASDNIEIMKEAGPGRIGHLAISVNNVDRAMAFLKTKGVLFDESSKRENASGKTTFIYLKDEISGYAVHLTCK